MIGSLDILIIYNLIDGKNFTIRDNFGFVLDTKLLKEDNLVLIETNSGKSVVFDLFTHNRVFNPMTISEIASLDSLNRSMSKQ